METLPEALLAAALQFADVTTLFAVECASCHVRQVFLSQRIWERLARREVAVCEGDVPLSVLEWKRLVVVVVTQPLDSSMTLLDGVTACSSMDRSEESPSNTLTLSPCWLGIRNLWNRIEDTEEREQIYLSLARRAQKCQLGSACYWSSEPSYDRNTEDFIEYSVAPKSLLRVVQVIPYRAFWHPGAPTYSPRAVSLQFYSGEKELPYESFIFPLENKMELNELKLPRPLWLPKGGTMRLNMHGRHQVQTMDVPSYYSCISYVGALGHPAVELSPASPRRISFSINSQ